MSNAVGYFATDGNLLGAHAYKDKPDNPCNLLAVAITL